MKSKVERAEKNEWREADEANFDSETATPELKKKRLLDYSDAQNTPSPLSAVS